MKEIIIKSQSQFDKVKSSFEGKIIVRDTKELININRSFDNAYIVLSDNATIESVYGNATIEFVYGNATIEFVYGNATIDSVSNNATIKYVYDNATIKYVSDNATIKYVSDNATIGSVSGNATIGSVSDNATIKYVYDNATIKYVYDNATIKYVYDNATIESVYDNATILLLTGFACICFLYGAKKIISRGMNMIRQIGTVKIDLDISNTVNFIQITDDIKETPNFKIYSKLFPVTKKGKDKVIMYKAVRKTEDGRYISNYCPDFEYKIGEVKTETCDTNTNNSCSNGIHISHLRWAVLFGKDWDNLAILEVESNIKDIVVSKDCNGKVRTSKVKVLRELDKSEY